ncbi:hypothetical protein B0T21DRAFT_423757 [Apiosordaria backusii]|uniref:2EXR domain-containing protein n=1 Tax=Apiosordaria backusii TaxID=314023 RepID=A0AA40ASQ9_9PEZI|nr:hypothetical protein B0T21DRAFT_423757 [Apiosordaria backusii]
MATEPREALVRSFNFQFSKAPFLLFPSAASSLPCTPGDPITEDVNTATESLEDLANRALNLNKTSPGSINDLPAEIRLKIYRLVWEPTTIVLGHGQPQKQPRKKPPVTLFINYEAREETLKHYHHYCFAYPKWEEFEKSQQGYINPRLDILHLLASATDPLIWGNATLNFSGLEEPLLHITLPRYVCPSEIIEALDTKHGLLPAIKTIDYWRTDERFAREHNPSENSNRSQHEVLWKVTSRYRICRTTSNDRIALTGWEDAVFRPAIKSTISRVNPEAPKCADCSSRPRESRPPIWQWQYVAEESVPSDGPPIPTNSPGDVFSQKSHLPNPNTGSALRVPAAVSHWFDRNARKVFRQKGVLVFDQNHHTRHSDTPPPAPQEQAWSLLKVVSPNNVWHREVTALAFANLFHSFRRAPVSLPGPSTVPSPAGASSSAPSSPNNTPTSVLKPISEMLRNLGQKQRDHARRRQHHFAADREILDEEILDGVCAPGFLHENEILEFEDQEERYDMPEDTLTGQPKYYPVVSGKRIREVNFAREYEESVDEVSERRQVEFAYGEHRRAAEREWHECVGDEA